MCVGGALLAAGVIAYNRYKNGSFFGASNGGEPLATVPRYYSADERKKMEESRLAKERAVLAAGQKAADGESGGEKEQNEKAVVCPACGARIAVTKEGVSQCPYCGAPVDASENKQPPQSGEDGE